MTDDMDPSIDPDDEIITLAAACQFNPKRWSRLAWD